MNHVAAEAQRTEAGPARPRSVIWLAVIGLAVTTALTVYGADSRAELALVLPLIIVTVIGVYGFVLPRTLGRPSRGGTALLLSGIAIVVLLPAFWSGESFLLGAAGALLGSARTAVSTESRRRSKRAIAAVILGLVAAVGYLAIYVLDAILPPSGG